MEPFKRVQRTHSRNHDQGAHKETTLLETLGNLEQAGGCFKSESLGNTFPVPGYFGLFQYRRRLSLNPKPYIDVCWVFGFGGFMVCVWVLEFMAPGFSNWSLRF